MLPRDISTPFSHAHLFVRTPLLNYSFLTSFNKIPFSMQPFKSKLTARDKSGDAVSHQNTLRVTPNASPEFSGSGAVSRCEFENRGQGGRNIWEHQVWVFSEIFSHSWRSLGRVLQGILCYGCHAIRDSG